MNKAGFTLVEIVTVIFIFSLLALFAANIMFFSVNSFTRLTNRSEAKEEAWVALDFLVTQIKHANGYQISYRSGNSLRQLDLFTAVTPGAPEHNYEFRYDRGAARLNFGGNELASGITDIVIFINSEKELMYITVYAENTGETVEFSTCVSLRHKELR